MYATLTKWVNQWNIFLSLRGRYICLFNGCPLQLCPWKGTASTGPREEVFQRRVLLSQPHEQTRLTIPTDLTVMQPTLLQGWETMARFPRTIPDPFAIGSPWNWTGAPPPPISQAGEITKSSPRRTRCKLWVCFFDWELKGTVADAEKYFICPARLHQPLNYPPKLGCHTLALQGIFLRGQRINNDEFSRDSKHKRFSD